LTSFVGILKFTEEAVRSYRIAESWRKGGGGEGCKCRGAGGFALDRMAEYRCGWKGGSGEGDFDASVVTGFFDSVFSVHLILLRDADCVTGRDDGSEWENGLQSPNMYKLPALEPALGKLG
jgi:hypothetical protein